jgi:GAF domain-containing protein
MRQARDFTEVDNTLTQAPAAALRLASVAIFRLIDGKLRRVGDSIGWAATDMRTLDPAHFPAFFKQLLDENPVTVPRTLAEQPNLPRDDLFPCLAVPMRGGVTESVAVIFCGPHLSGADISYDERELLREFAARAALSYDRVEANQLRREIEFLRAQLSTRNPQGG